MLYYIDKNGVNQEDVVFVICKANKLSSAIKEQMVYTKNNACEGIARFYGYINDEELMSTIDLPKLHRIKYWNNSVVEKSLVQSEFLVPADVPFDLIEEFLVFNYKAFNQLITMGIAENKVKINRSLYF